MGYLFTSESVSEGHPDKVADQISDALIDNFLAFDPDSKVACETLVTTGQVVLAGEVKSKAYLDVQEIAREVIRKIGYTKSEYMFEANSCGIFSAIHEQSSDINQGVDKVKKEDQGAGDQGMMFGYASNETEDFMPLPLDIANTLLKELAAVRRENKQIKYLRPDAKSQVTLEYDDNNKPIRIDAIVVSTQHDDFDTEEKMQKKISYDISVAQPTSINVNTYGTSKVKLSDGEIAEKVKGIFDMRPYFIEQRLKLRNPIYSETAAYGHMGRKSELVTKTFRTPDGKEKK